MKFCYTHRTLPHVFIMREVCACKWELAQRPTTGQYADTERAWDTQTKCNVYVKLLLSAQGAMQKSWKDC